LSDPKDKQNPDAPELPVDREQGLALQFDDPGIAELLPLMSGEGPATSLTADVADAVQELVFDASAQLAPEANNDTLEAAVNPALDFDLSSDLANAGYNPGDITSTGLINEPTELLTIEGAGLDNVHNIARIDVADRMFDLLITEKSFGDLVENLLATFMKASSGTAGSILELDHGTNEFFFRAVFGSNDPDKVKAFRVPAGKGIVGHVAESGQPLLLNDMEGDERQLRAISMSTGLEIVTCMALPLLITNRLYGVVEIFNKVGGGRFDEADLRLMEDSARMATKVLEVRFLMAELFRRAG